MPSSRKVFGAISWSAVDLMLRFGINFLTIIVLARILVPADFGLVAILAFFASISELLVDSGFSQALIQRQNTTRIEESTIFFFTLIMGAVIGLGLCVIAPWIAIFFGYAILEDLTRVLALNVFINSFGTIHITLLTKKMDFRTITKVGITATIFSAVIAISMALEGWGVWSLIGQTLSATVVRVITLWVFHPWRPQWTFDTQALSSCFRFGGFLLLTGILNKLYTNLYAMLIGKLHSVHNVGLYFQAQRLQQMPVNVLTHIVGRVAFPLFSVAANDKPRLAKGLRKALRSVMFVNAPLMIGLCFLAEPIVYSVFGEKWLPCVVVLRILSIAGLLWPLNALNINVLKAQGHSALNARIQLIKLSIGISLLLISSPYGIVAVAYAQVVASFFAFWLNAHYSMSFLNYGGMAQIRDIAPYLLVSMPMALVIQGIVMLDLAVEVELPLAVFSGALIYLGGCKAAALDPLENLLEMVTPKAFRKG